MHRISDLVGKPFISGARGPDAYDCWGLAVEAFSRLGVEIPDYRLICGAVGTAVNKKRPEWVPCIGQIPVPALIVFTTLGLCDHVGVYVGDGKFIHSHIKTGVAITPTDHIYWKKRIEGYYLPGWLA